MPTFTLEQRRLLEQAGDDPVRVSDPEMGTEYVILKADLYDRIRESEDVRSAYPLAMEVFGRDGWDDPVMDEYNALDPRQ